MNSVGQFNINSDASGVVSIASGSGYRGSVEIMNGNDCSGHCYIMRGSNCTGNLYLGATWNENTGSDVYIGGKNKLTQIESANTYLKSPNLEISSVCNDFIVKATNTNLTGTNVTAKTQAIDNSSNLIATTAFVKTCLSAGNSISGSNVTSTGNVTASGDISGNSVTTGSVTSSGAIKGASLTTTGNISGDNVTASGLITATRFNTTSDYRIKSNITSLDETYTVDNLNPVTYLNKQTDKQDIGLIAHELQEKYPILVNGIKDGDAYQSVNYIGLIPVLIKEIQTLKQTVTDLNKRIKTLEEKP
jgi:hypothetical protein